jgi:hypothetical protein
VILQHLPRMLTEVAASACVEDCIHGSGLTSWQA